jgi:5-methylcytosine-specific restriction protein A
VKQTPIVRKTPLRRAQFARNSAPPQSGSKTRKSAPAHSRFDAATKQLIRDRDHHRCVRCGKEVPPGTGSIQHRRAAGMGGTKDPVSCSPANGVLLCGSATSPGGCHAWCESRDPDAAAMGYVLSQQQDPREVRVLWHSEWVLLRVDGTICPV